jgi:hypothetical protein
MLGIGAIRVDQTPTDYFPADEFERLIDALISTAIIAASRQRERIRA